MASSLLRGVLSRGRTAQFLNGRNFSKAIDSSLANPAKSEVLKEYNFSLFERDINISFLRRPFVYLYDKQKTVQFENCIRLTITNYIPDPISDPAPNPTREPTVFSAASSSVIKYVDRLIKNKPGSDYLYGAWSMIHSDAKFQTYSRADKLKLMSGVLDAVQNYPQVDKKEIYELRIYVKTLSVDDGKENTTKKQISSRAVEVVQSSPLVSKYKVTNTSHFRKDLHLDNDGCRHIISALQMEFKIHLPNKIDSCKSAIDYIYDNLDERMPLEEFRNEFQYAPKSPSRS